MLMILLLLLVVVIVVSLLLLLANNSASSCPGQPHPTAANSRVESAHALNANSSSISPCYTRRTQISLSFDACSLWLVIFWRPWPLAAGCLMWMSMSLIAGCSQRERKNASESFGFRRNLVETSGSWAVGWSYSLVSECQQPSTDSVRTSASFAPTHATGLAFWALLKFH